MVNIVALLFSATNEETPYEQLLLGIRDVARGFFFLRNGYATDTEALGRTRQKISGSQGRPARCLEK